LVGSRSPKVTCLGPMLLLNLAVRAFLVFGHGALVVKHHGSQGTPLFSLSDIPIAGQCPGKLSFGSFYNADLPSIFSPFFTPSIFKRFFSRKPWATNKHLSSSPYGVRLLLPPRGATAFLPFKMSLDRLLPHTKVDGISTSGVYLQGAPPHSPQDWNGRAACFLPSGSSLSY